MEVLKDAQEALDEVLKKRTRDPFLATFALTFLFWNYPIVIYLFSDLSPNEKVEKIDLLLTYNSVWPPTLTTILILFGMPLVLSKGYEIIEKNKVKMLNYRLKAEDDLLPNANKIKDLELQLSKEVGQNNILKNVISEKDQEIGGLKIQLAAAQSKLTSINDVENPKDETLSYLKKAGLDKAFEKLASEISISTVLANTQNASLIMKFINANLIKKYQPSGHIHPSLILTPLGTQIHKILLK